MNTNEQVTLRVEVDLGKMTIDEIIFIEDMGKKDAEGKPLAKDASFRSLVAILDKAVTVDGYERVGQLPVPAIVKIMDAVMREMELMGSVSGPTKTSD